MTGAADAGKLDMRALDLGGRPLAMLVNFLCPPGGFSFKTAFDEDYARFSPGVLLQRENLALLDRSGIDWTDSCAAADHPMIERIWRDLLFLTHATTTGAITSIALAAIDTALWDLRARKMGLPLWKLAGGDVSAEIPGTARKDEIGQMAAAVAVFRDNIIERGRLAREADETRTMTEQERREREAARTREAEQVSFAVHSLADGLGRRSGEHHLVAADVALRLGTLAGHQH